MSLSRWWPLFFVILEVAVGSPLGGMAEEANHNPGTSLTSKLTHGDGERHVRAAGGIDDLGILGAEADSLADPLNGGSSSSWGSDEVEFNSPPSAAVIVPLSLLKNLASTEILKYLRPVTSKSLVENPAKWYIPLSFNLGSGSSAAAASGSSGFPRYSRADSNFIRFGRSHNSGTNGFSTFLGTNKKNNFIRLGRENPRQNNFIRLGRSASSADSSNSFHTLGLGYFPIDSSPKKISSAPEFSNDYGSDSSQLDSSQRLG